MQEDSRSAATQHSIAASFLLSNYSEGFSCLKG